MAATGVLILAVPDVERAIMVPVKRWRGHCWEIAALMVQHRVIEGATRYGHWVGPVAKKSMFYARPIVHHGWIELPDGRVCDPTRFEFEQVAPYIYLGRADHYDAGGNIYRLATERPVPAPAPDEARQFALDLTDQARAHVTLLLSWPGPSYSFGQLFWLANLALCRLHPHALDIFTAIRGAGQAALIPRDNDDLVWAAGNAAK